MSLRHGAGKSLKLVRNSHLIIYFNQFCFQSLALFDPRDFQHYLKSQFKLLHFQLQLVDQSFMASDLGVYQIDYYLD